MKKLLAILLTLVMLSGTFICFAAELNQDAVNAHYGQFKNYLLLGDSAASGYRDELTQNDKDFNEAYQETVYYRVPGSYADIIANAIIEDKSMTSFAGPGYRTIEVRYMLEDDFDEEDDYMFHPSQLDSVGFAGSEEWRAAFKKAVAEADLITLGIGGNDWGAYLSWVVADVLEAEHAADKYIKMVEDTLKDNETNMETLEKVIEIAYLAGALPSLIETVPTALNYGLSTFYKNWDIMIQDIYDLNPDVTIMAVGMSNNSIKGHYYTYGDEGGEAIETAEQNEATAGIMNTIINFIMSVGNKPMIDGAEKFGYTFVDIDGATYVDSHYDAEGHVFVANKIIEALPDAEISKKYTDVTTGHKYYASIEYALLKGIMTETSATTFSPDAALTVGQLEYAMNVINGTDNAADSADEVSALRLAISIFSAGARKGFTGFFKGLGLTFRVLSENSFNMGKIITRGEASTYFRALDEI